MKISREISDRDKLIIYALVLVLVIYLSHTYIYSGIKSNKSNLELELSDLKGHSNDKDLLLSEENDVNNQIDGIDKVINDLKNSGGKGAINTQDFLCELSGWANDLDVGVGKFREIEVEEQNGVWRSQYEINLNGNLNDLVVLVSKLDNLGISYNVISMSLRQDLEYDWLKRDYTSLSKLDWLTIKEDNEEDKDIEDVEDTEDTDLIDELDDIDSSDLDNITEGSSGSDNSGENEFETKDETKEKTLEDQLMILLGHDDDVKEGSHRGLYTRNSSTKGVLSENSIIKDNVNTDNIGLNESIYNLDFTLEFIMFRDPYTVKVSNDNKDLFVVDKLGNKLSKYVIDNKIQEGIDFLSNEIDKVEKDIKEMQEEKKSTEEMEKYLKYLKDYNNGV